jgi:hypothetical protein
MIALSKPDKKEEDVHVAVMTRYAESNGGTQPQSKYGIPNAAGVWHVKQTPHTVPQNSLEHLPDKPYWKDIKGHQMDSTKLNQIKNDTKTKDLGSSSTSSTAASSSLEASG